MLGDFANGWPTGLFQEIFDYGSTCDVGFTVQDCPALAPYVQTSQACPITGVVVDEDIGFYNNLTSLPGNNAIWGGSVAKIPIPGYVETAQFMQVTAESKSLSKFHKLFI